MKLLAIHNIIPSVRLVTLFVLAAAGSAQAQWSAWGGAGFEGDVFYGGEVGNYEVFPPDDYPANEFWIPNFPPVADASATATTIISSNGINAAVTLNGSRSYDPGGDPMLFLWIEEYPLALDLPDLYLADADVAHVILPVGTHWIRLWVSDEISGSADVPAGVAVEVITPGTAVRRIIQSTAEADLGARNKQPLLASLNAAQISFDRNNSTSGLNQLAAFQNKVRAQIAPSNPALADQLAVGAQEIIDALEQ